MDLQMPGEGEIAATRKIMQTDQPVSILMLTLFEDDDSVFATLRAGSRGYILKDADEDEIARANRAVSKGEAIFSLAIATRLLDFFATSRPSVAKEAFPGLTDREREILHLVAEGLSNAEIADPSSRPAMPEWDDFSLESVSFPFLPIRSSGFPASWGTDKDTVVPCPISLWIGSDPRQKSARSRIPKRPRDFLSLPWIKL